jgi:hypothetical protein
MDDMRDHIPRIMGPSARPFIFTVVRMKHKQEICTVNVICYVSRITQKALLSPTKPLVLNNKNADRRFSRWSGMQMFRIISADEFVRLQTNTRAVYRIDVKLLALLVRYIHGIACNFHQAPVNIIHLQKRFWVCFPGHFFISVDMPSLI